MHTSHNIQNILEQKLNKNLKPSHLEVNNESHMHRGQKDAQSHFRAVVVSDVFQDCLPIKRHQLVYQILSEEMTIIHALALHTYTRTEWAEKGKAPPSPDCAGSRRPSEIS